MADQKSRPGRPVGLLRAATGRLGGTFALPRQSRVVDPLLRTHRMHHPRADLEFVRRAYHTAERLHRGQLRKSGEPYVTHPLAVAQILADLGMDTPTLAAALLHDTVEDTPYTRGELWAEFGREVAILVDGVTKLDGSKWGARAEAETFRKMILVAASDLRVLVIKLADRLHNLRTLGFQPRRKQERIARASLELLAPFAERLGMYELKREMDDLCFATLKPLTYETIAAAVADVEPTAREWFAPLLDHLRSALAASRVDAQVVLHRRHLYAIHDDVRGRFDALHPSDVFRVLVVVDGEDKDCYVALGAVHATLHPVPGRLKDFVAMPRFNLYRSLHTRATAHGGGGMDIMIRTRAMHLVAERGIAAHIASAAGTTAEKVAGRLDLEWLRRLLAWQNDVDSASFLDSLRGDLRSGTIVAFTPRGKTVALPADATPIDFAYALDPDIGSHATGALVNGRLAALTSRLENGAVVEVLTAPETSPSTEWLEHAKTPAARLHIRQWVTDRQAEDAATAGRGLLAEAVAKQGLDLLDLESSGVSERIARRLRYRTLDEMYAALHTDPGEVENLADKLTGAAPVPSPPRSTWFTPMSSPAGE